MASDALDYEVISDLAGQWTRNDPNAAVEAHGVDDETEGDTTQSA